MPLRLMVKTAYIYIYIIIHKVSWIIKYILITISNVLQYHPKINKILHKMSTKERKINKTPSRVYFNP